MAFIKFRTAYGDNGSQYVSGGQPGPGYDVLINVDHIVDVYVTGGRVRIGMTSDDYHDVAGTFDEVMQRLGDATDVWMAPEDAPAVDEVKA